MKIGDVILPVWSIVDKIKSNQRILRDKNQKLESDDYAKRETCLLFLK